MKPHVFVSVIEDSKDGLCEVKCAGRIVYFRFWGGKCKTNLAQCLYVMQSAKKIFNSSHILGIINYPSQLLLLIIAVMLSKYSASLGHTGNLSLQ